MIPNHNLESVITYIKNEGIKIDFNSFLQQAESHPDYPTILAITDTLDFFDIDNGVLAVEIIEIPSLPDCFVALLAEKKNLSQLYYIEKKEDNYFYFQNKIPVAISKQELESRWKNTVLLIEKTERDIITTTNTNKIFLILPCLSVLLLLSIIVQFQASIQNKIFFIFPVLGFLFSITALKDLLGINSDLVNSFCNITSYSSCTSVVSSKKWKFFEIINFSDLSIVIFSSQIFCLLLFLFIADTISYFTIQKIMLLCTIPVVLASLYYQKVIEKKWCPLCLVIIGIILLEFVYIVFLQQYLFNFSIQSLIFYGFIFVTTTLVWLVLKKLLTLQKELKEFQIKGNRFMRNYEIFKNTLIASSPIDDNLIRSVVILLGNVDAPLKIVVVTSPFCSFCSEVHTIIEKIINKYSDKVCFEIRFNFNFENSDEKSKKIHQQLISIYFTQGQEAFMNSLHDWFQNKDENKFKIIENNQMTELKVNQILAEQFNWNQVNQITYTPAIIINGYFFPKQYDRNDLIHFINDLYEDEDFNKEQ